MKKLRGQVDVLRGVAKTAAQAYAHKGERSAPNVMLDEEGNLHPEWRRPTEVDAQPASAEEELQKEVERLEAPNPNPNPNPNWSESRPLSSPESVTQTLTPILTPVQELQHEILNQSEQAKQEVQEAHQATVRDMLKHNQDLSEVLQRLTLTLTGSLST